MINREHKFIFIHIPKNAGEAISEALGIKPSRNQHEFKFETCILDKHETITECMVLKKSIENYFRFSFVRNPWDRLVSMWSYSRKRNIQPAASVSFEYYIKHQEAILAGAPERYLSNSQRKINVLYPQYFYISDWWGNNVMDFVGRFENLQNDFDTICDKIGIPRRIIPQKNSSNHKHYTEYYNTETREIVAKKYAKDIEYFGYKFGE
jgi:hypothetical protein